MASYPRPRYNVPIFVYDNGNNQRPSTSVVVPGPSPPDTSITEERMTRIALTTNFNSLFSSYPWLPSPNVKPACIYVLWNQLVYGEDYLTDLGGGSYAWNELLEYTLTGVYSTSKITGLGIDTLATTTVPRGLQPNNELTLTRTHKPFVIGLAGTLTNGCVIFEVDNFRLELQANYTVKYFLDDTLVATSAVLGNTADPIKYLGFSGSALVGTTNIQDTTVNEHSRLDMGSDITTELVSYDALPSIIKSGTGTWTFKDTLLLGVNLYDSLTSENLLYEGYLMLDMCRVRCQPPIWIA